MSLNSRLIFVCVLATAIVALSNGSATAQTTPQDVRGEAATALDTRQFTRDTLLRRFDADGDARLSAAERSALRESFGGIDVPMLPATPFGYTDDQLPVFVREWPDFDLTDNTPNKNPLTDQGAILGRVLFYDRHLSKNDKIACASCHLQQAGFSDPRQFSPGFAGGQTRRNAMNLVNLRYSNLKGRRPGFFWDERAPSLEAQALMPIQDAVEMGMDLADLEQKLQTLPYYPPLFQAAFGSPKVTRERIAKAIAQFLRSMVSFDSTFDRAAANEPAKAMSGDFDMFTDEENRGKSLFFDGVGGIAEFGCAVCHLPPTFGMAASANNGLDTVYYDNGLGELGRPSNDPLTPSNDGKFKAPSLRNIELTAPYMHDGRFDTLEEVIEHYSAGVHPHENLGLAFEEQAAVGPTGGFGLTPMQKSALVAFLRSLTDRQFTTDARFSDPFVRMEP